MNALCDGWPLSPSLPPPHRDKPSIDFAVGKVVRIDACGFDVRDPLRWYARAASFTQSAGGIMPTSPPLDSPTPRRSLASPSGRKTQRRSSSKGRHFPADPPRTEEIIAVMRCCDESEHGGRARALIVVLWRAGLRIQEALDLNELDLDRRRGSVLVR